MSNCQESLELVKLLHQASLQLSWTFHQCLNDSVMHSVRPLSFGCPCHRDRPWPVHLVASTLLLIEMSPVSLRNYHPLRHLLGDLLFLQEDRVSKLFVMPMDVAMQGCAPKEFVRSRHNISCNVKKKRL